MMKTFREFYKESALDAYNSGESPKSRKDIIELLRNLATDRTSYGNLGRLLSYSRGQISDLIDKVKDSWVVYSGNKPYTLDNLISAVGSYLQSLEANDIEKDNPGMI